jgi:CheY-like chemotaxis protein
MKSKDLSRTHEGTIQLSAQISEPTSDILRVLVVEDDLSTRFLWETMLARVHPRVLILWADAVDQAEATIQTARRQQRPFNLVICDLRLNGPLTGVDLWRQQKDEGEIFMLASTMTRAQFELMTLPGEIPPLFVEKRGGLSELMEVVKGLVKFRD